MEQPPLAASRSHSAPSPRSPAGESALECWGWGGRVLGPNPPRPHPGPGVGFWRQPSQSLPPHSATRNKFRPFGERETESRLWPSSTQTSFEFSPPSSGPGLRKSRDRPRCLARAMISTSDCRAWLGRQGRGLRDGLALAHGGRLAFVRVGLVCPAATEESHLQVLRACLPGNRSSTWQCLLRQV